MFMPNVNPSAASFSLISLSDFLPKLRYLSISASVFIASCPTVVMFALFRQLAARTLNSISLTLILSSFLSLDFSSSCLVSASSNSTAFLSYPTNTSRCCCKMADACGFHRVTHACDRREQGINGNHTDELVHLFVLVSGAEAAADLDFELHL